jgi:hypothetical protein
MHAQELAKPECPILFRRSNIRHYYHSLFVMPGLDPGIAWRNLTLRLQPEVLMPSAQLLRGDTRIKSGYDGIKV